MAEAIYEIIEQKDIHIMLLKLDYVTMHQNKDLMDTFARLIDGGKKKIILDLSRTAFMSSIVMASMVFMKKKAESAHGNIALCCVKDKVKELLVVTKLDKVFDVFETRDEAIAGFK